jgi:alpha-glucosidase
VTSPDHGADLWWRHAIFYQIYIRSFYDSDNNGIGDLEGIRRRLPYLQDLGVDAVWITPFYRSPMADHGYDVADPRDVDPIFGDLADFDRLIADAHARGIKVTVDIVPNHTSDQHDWFQAALQSPPGSAERARYIFRDGRGADGAEPPNNWRSTFGGPAWARVPDGQWYLHLFAPEQPDLDWTNPEVLADAQRTLRFWLDRGVDGFRVDVAHGLAKPAGLPDMDHSTVRDVLLGVSPDDVRFDDEGVHVHWREIRRVLDEYGPEKMAIGEIWVATDERLARYVRPDELHLAFNFRLVQAKWNRDDFRSAIVDSITAMSSVGASTTWVLSNHDIPRHVTRYGGGEVGTRRARAAALLQLALPGAAFVYQGDELGLPNVDNLPDEALQDPIWERSGHRARGRDGCRVPMPWSGTRPPYGFTGDDVQPWLPMPEDWKDLTVEAQTGNGASMLELYRAALRQRAELPGLRAGEFAWVDAPAGCLAFARPDGFRCIVNFGAAPVPLPAGPVLLASQPVAGAELPPDAAVWVIPD